MSVNNQKSVEHKVCELCNLEKLPENIDLEFTIFLDGLDEQIIIGSDRDGLDCLEIKYKTEGEIRNSIFLAPENVTKVRKILQLWESLKLSIDEE